MSKNREQKHAKHLADQKAHEQHRHEAEVAHENHHEHLVEAPKGTSRARFLFNFLLVVFLLVIFSISGPFMSALSGRGGGADDVYMSWSLPGGEMRSLNRLDFFEQKRNFANLEVMFPWLGMQGIDPGDDESTARFLISEDLAHWSGVSAASDDVADLILSAFGDAASYKNWVASRRNLTTTGFEKLLHRGRTVQRYMQLLSSGASLVSPVEVAEAWQAQNPEYDLQYIQVANEDFSEAARAQLPGNEELQDWFDGLGPFQKARFNTQESWSADLAWFDVKSYTDMTALFEKYPRPEDEDADEMAQNYYNSFSYARFVRPQPEDEAEDDGEEESEPQDRFYSFDEVAETVKREAPIYYSMTDWLSHMQARKAAGEVVDLQTEAIALGFLFTPVDAHTRDGWSEAEEPWAGSFLASSTANLPEGNLAPRVIVEEGALIVSKVVEKLPPSLPPFDEIRDRVADQWVEERRAELAVEALAALRAKFVAAPEDEAQEGAEDSAEAGSDEADPLDELPREAVADLEAFRAAAGEAGFEVVERGYRTRYPRPGEDLTALTEADTYLQGNTLYYSLAEGEIAEPESSRDGKYSYLVRSGGKREADISRMDPSELQAMTMQLGRDAEMSFFTTTFGSEDWVKQKFHLYLKSWEENDDAPTN